MRAQLYRDISDPIFKFWKAYAQYKLNDPNEAINELMAIQHKKEIQFATIMALIHYHSSCENIDHDAIQNLKYQREEARKLSSDKSFNLLAFFFLFLGEPSKAQEFLEQTQSQSSSAQIAKAWILLSAPETQDQAFNLFQKLVRDVKCEQQRAKGASRARVRATEYHE